jgi:hypothetical protein
VLIWRVTLDRSGNPSPGESTLASSALNAYLTCLRDLRASAALQMFEARVGAPIRMGFSLHAGWAIEGAVGSVHKIDATYLSPHINIAARMESQTEKYGVDILMTGEFVVNLPPAWKAKLRLVDTITVKGSSLPVEVFVIDDLRPVPRGQPVEQPNQEPWDQDRDGVMPLAIPYKDLHAAAFEAFTASRWPEARSLFQKFLTHLAEAGQADRPTEIILEWMAVQQTPEGQAPATFQGVRNLTSK